MRRGWTTIRRWKSRADVHGPAIHTTPPTLLERLRSPDDEAAWGRLVDLYLPLLFSWAKRQGLPDHDAADLVQEVFVALVQTLPTFTYDPGRGQFRNWLRTLMLNKLRDRKRRAAREERVRARHRPEVEAPDGAGLFSEAEYRQAVTRRAMQLLQQDFAPVTWKAFWETVVEGRPPREVARELNCSENSVYAAKCRVLRRLRQELRGLLE
jgi:RNA polymerase sigma-70 factor (ECF subfamily)